MNSEMQSLRNEKYLLESDIKVLELWYNLKNSLRSKYKLSTEAFNSIKKANSNVLTRNDFRTNVYSNFKNIIYFQQSDSIFQRAKTDQISLETFNRMWNQWECDLQSNQHRLSIINEKLELIKMLNKQSEVDVNQSSLKKKRLIASLGDCSSLNQLQNKLENIVTITQKNSMINDQDLGFVDFENYKKRFQTTEDLYTTPQKPSMSSFGLPQDQNSSIRTSFLRQIRTSPERRERKVSRSNSNERNERNENQKINKKQALLNIMKSRREEDQKQRRYRSTSAKRSGYEDEIILTKGIDGIFDIGKQSQEGKKSFNSRLNQIRQRLNKIQEEKEVKQFRRFNNQIKQNDKNQGYRQQSYSSGRKQFTENQGLKFKQSQQQEDQVFGNKSRMNLEKLRQELDQFGQPQNKSRVYLDKQMEEQQFENKQRQKLERMRQGQLLEFDQNDDSKSRLNMDRLRQEIQQINQISPEIKPRYNKNSEFKSFEQAPESKLIFTQSREDFEKSDQIPQQKSRLNLDRLRQEQESIDQEKRNLYLIKYISIKSKTLPSEVKDSELNRLRKNYKYETPTKK